ncbi:MAG TPA: hypothetical protein DCL41_04990 [Bdellovibrionales bacterium]|nr:hypothetical protein [Pseudobdellovibrionaceae bacterium]HAG91202.1 hypothetical protein [Bdellovibrionales bacterium]|tara:strand:+ start:432 stop:1631 length:1200 start_codon:yes stop_codon:yes gene_type:complete
MLRVYFGTCLLGLIGVAAFHLSGIELYQMNQDQWIQNPLLKTYERMLGNEFDLGSLKTVDMVQEEENQDPLVEFSLFGEPPKSVDILVFGDSSTYGYLPDVLEKKTGLKIRFFNWGAQRINLEMIQVIKLLSKVYLKPGGKVILAYDYWTMDVGLDASLLVHKDWVSKVSKMNVKDFTSWLSENLPLTVKSKVPSDLVELNQETLEEHILPVSHSGISLNRLISFFQFENYRKFYISLRDILANRFYLKLPQIEFYSKLVSNPVRDQEEESRKRKILVGENFKTYFIEKPTKFAIVDDGSPVKADPEKLENLKLTAKEFSNLGFELYFLIHPSIFEYHYTSLRAYAPYFVDSDHIIHLGRFHSDHPLPMENGAHMANESGMFFTLMLAEKLNSFEKSEK